MPPVREMKHCAICGRTAVKTCVKCKRCVCGAIGRCRGKEWRVGKGKAVICQACLSSGPPVVVQGRSFGRIRYPIRRCATCGRRAQKSCRDCCRWVCSTMGTCRGMEWRQGMGKVVLCKDCVAPDPRSTEQEEPPASTSPPTSPRTTDPETET